MANLEGGWTTRSGGGGRTEHLFLNFLVDGAALTARFNADSISPFVGFAEDEQNASIDRLLRKCPPDVAHGRSE